MSLRKPLHNGIWDEFQIDGQLYIIKVCQDGRFQGVTVIDSEGISIGPDLENQNVIFYLNRKGRWLSVISGTIYDKATIYWLIDLQKYVGNPQKRNWKAHITEVTHGWFADKDPFNGITLDFDAEKIYFPENNKRISFTDYMIFQHKYKKYE